MSNDAMKCPDAECLSAFLAGAVTPAELASVNAHLPVCADCREVVGLSAYVAGVIASEPLPAVLPRQRRWGGWLSATAAAIAAIAVLAVSYRSWTPREPRQLLVDAVSRERRYVEPRLSGGFPWAPLATASRSAEPLHTDRMRLIGAAGTVLERTEGDDSPAARHAAALAQLLAERPHDAARLLSKLASSTSDAEISCDLAAALYTTALQRSDRAKAAEALAAANFALRLRPAMPEALFNRALILEYLGLETQAREAWDRYLAVDPHSAWAAEARDRRARLAPSTSQGGEMRAHAALLAAARNPGNRSDVRTQLLAAARDAAYEARWNTSLYLLGLELDAVLHTGDASRVAEALLMRARIALHIGHDAMARLDAELAAQAIARIRDHGERDRAETSRQVIVGALESSPAGAVQFLSRLIAHGHRSYLPEMYLHRGHAFEKLRRLDDAAADYEAGISRVGWDRSWDRTITRDELYDAAIALAVTRGDASGAFAHSERSRGGRPDLELAVPREHAIVSYVSLEDRLLIFAIRNGEVVVVESAVTRDVLAREVDRLATAVGNEPQFRHAASLLYTRLIAPAAKHIGTARTVVFVPDAPLRNVPFSALVGRDGRFLVEAHRIVVASSVTAYLKLAAHAGRADVAPSLLLITGPPRPDGAFGRLFAAEREARNVAAVYRDRVERVSSSITLPDLERRSARAGVIHFTGHAVDPDDDTDAALVTFTPSQGAGRLNATEIAAAQLSRGGVVVLAACSTGKSGSRNGSSVAQAFLDAGASSVVATLWPIQDDFASEFFPRFHQHLVRGESAADALRASQLEWIRQGAPLGTWAAVQVIGS